MVASLSLFAINLSQVGPMVVVGRNACFKLLHSLCVSDGTTVEELWKVEVPVQPRLGRLNASNLGGVELEITGSASVTNMVERSSNLLQWFSLITNCLPMTGILSGLDTNGTARNFYRSKQILP